MYCERVLVESGETDRYEAVLDFSDDSEGIEQFREKMRIELTIENCTLLVLENLHKEKLMFREGCWYEIKPSFFDNFIFDNQRDDQSRVLAYLRYNSSEPLNVKSDKNPEEFYSDSELDEYRVKEFNVKDYFGDELPQKLNLIVRNVGCGNWNEIRGSDFWLIYDMGGDVKFTKNEMKKIIKKVNFTRTFIWFLSHWDVDHYRAILDLDKTDLRKMICAIVPSKIPKTKQATATLNCLRDSKIPIIIIKPSIRRSKSRVNLDLWKSIKLIGIYRSSDGQKMNQSGIVLKVESHRNVVILTGDHYYYQIYDYVIDKRNSKPKILIVPHHAGYAGHFDQKKWDNIKFLSGAISTKTGRYKNLPLATIHDYFICRKFWCTDCKGLDYHRSF